MSGQALASSDEWAEAEAEPGEPPRREDEEEAAPVAAPISADGSDRERSPRRVNPELLPAHRYGDRCVHCDLEARHFCVTCRRWVCSGGRENCPWTGMCSCTGVMAGPVDQELWSQVPPSLLQHTAFARYLPNGQWRTVEEWTIMSQNSREGAQRFRDAVNHITNPLRSIVQPYVGHPPPLPPSELQLIAESLRSMARAIEEGHDAAVERQQVLW